VEYAMSEQPPMIVVDANAVQCAVAYESPVYTDGEPQVLVRFNNGEQVLLPMNLLIPQEDGRYRLASNVETLLSEYSNDVNNEVNNEDNNKVGNEEPVRFASGAPGRLVEEGDIVIPVADEFLNVEKRVVETGHVELRKTVQERVEVVDQPLFSEEVEIERIAINRPLAESVSSRYEGETLIIPLVEEVLVVQKRLVLREEIHIRKLRKEVHEPQEVHLRTEQVEVVRKPASDVVLQDETQEI
jgi:uncharacterized protein (TIGR02271 family)